MLSNISGTSNSYIASPERQASSPPKNEGGSTSSSLALQIFAAKVNNQEMDTEDLLLSLLEIDGKMEMEPDQNQPEKNVDKDPLKFVEMLFLALKKKIKGNFAKFVGKLPLQLKEKVREVVQQALQKGHGKVQLTKQSAAYFFVKQGWSGQREGNETLPVPAVTKMLETQSNFLPKEKSLSNEIQEDVEKLLDADREIAGEDDRLFLTQENENAVFFTDDSLETPLRSSGAKELTEKAPIFPNKFQSRQEEFQQIKRPRENKETPRVVLSKPVSSQKASADDFRSPPSEKKSHSSDNQIEKKDFSENLKQIQEKNELEKCDEGVLEKKEKVILMTKEQNALKQKVDTLSPSLNEKIYVERLLPPLNLAFLRPVFAPPEIGDKELFLRYVLEQQEVGTVSKDQGRKKADSKKKEQIPFGSLLTLLGFSFLAGASSVSSVLSYLEVNQKWLKRLFLLRSMPSAYMIMWVLMRLNFNKLEKHLEKHFSEITDRQTGRFCHLNSFGVGVSPRGLYLSSFHTEIKKLPLELFNWEKAVAIVKPIFKGVSWVNDLSDIAEEVLFLPLPETISGCLMEAIFVDEKAEPLPGFAKENIAVLANWAEKKLLNDNTLSGSFSRKRQSIQKDEHAMLSLINF